MGAFLEVDEARFGAQEIRYLYENAAYPLTRPTMLSGVRGGNRLEGRRSRNQEWQPL
jgi:hypothetical protein